MKKWHWGRFIGCLLGGAAVLWAIKFLVSAFGYYVLSSPFTSEEAWIIASSLFLLIATAAVLVTLDCRKEYIDELESRIKKLEEAQEDKKEEEKIC